MSFVFDSKLLFITTVNPLKVVRFDTKTWHCSVEFEGASNSRRFLVDNERLRGGSNMIQVTSTQAVGVVHKVFADGGTDGDYYHNFILVRKSGKSRYLVEWMSEDFK